MKRHLSVTLLICMLAMLISGCGSSVSDTAVSKAYEAEYGGVGARQAQNSTTAISKAEIVEELADVKATANVADSAVAGSAYNIAQKVIFTGTISLETLDFEKSRKEIFDYIDSIGGFVQNSSIHGGGINYKGLKSGEFVFRIPKQKYNGVFTDMGKFGTVVSQQSSGEDITERYFDNEARVKSLTIQEERLLDLLKKATKMEDIISLEKELQRVRYDIENLTGTLKKWDGLVEYSTITLDLREVEQIKNPEPQKKNGLLSRMSYGFENSANGMLELAQGLLVFLVASIPVVVPIAAFGLIIFLLLKRSIRRGNLKRQTNAQNNYNSINNNIPNNIIPNNNAANSNVPNNNVANSNVPNNNVANSNVPNNNVANSNVPNNNVVNNNDPEQK